MVTLTYPLCSSAAEAPKKQACVVGSMPVWATSRYGTLTPTARETGRSAGRPPMCPTCPRTRRLQRVAFVCVCVCVCVCLGHSVYGAAKSGINYLTKAFANAYGPKVRVNCILPGAFLTDIAKAWDVEAMKPGWKHAMALQRAGEPEEIVGAALYFASDASSYTTGAVLEVTGGSGGRQGMRDPRHDGSKGMAKL